MRFTFVFCCKRMNSDKNKKSLWFLDVIRLNNAYSCFMNYVNHDKIDL